MRGWLEGKKEHRKLREKVRKEKWRKQKVQIEQEKRKRRKEWANDRTENERDPCFLLSFLSFH